jgi:hypothetical protein
MNETGRATFEDCYIISCGMLQPEMTYLMESGFLDRRRVLFTPPGLHALPDRLEERLVNRVTHVREQHPGCKIAVVYGSKCYVNPDEPAKRVDAILQGMDPGIARVQGSYGYDMLAGLEERQQLSEGRQDKVLWFTAGWLRNWKTVYQRYFGWDAADANANFPGFYDRIIVLDSLQIADEYMTNHPEEVLELFDWTGLQVDFEPITLDYFKGLLTDALSMAVSAGVPE